MADYHEQLAKAGVLRDANGLQPSSKGFTETKELVAGYTIIR